MKLAVLTNILTPYRIPLFEELQRRVDDLTIFLMASSEENRLWKIGEHQLKTQVLPGIHLKPLGYEVSLHFNYGVVSALHKLNPDIVLSGGFAPANIAALLYCKLFRKKFIGFGELTLRNELEQSFIRKIIRKVLTKGSDGSIASSSEAKEAFIYYGAQAKEILTSILPIDLRYFHDKAETFRKSSEYPEMRNQFSHPLLLSVGRINRIKGFRELFGIYEQIIKDRPEVSLVIIGAGPEKRKYEELASKREWKNVHFLGFIQPDELPKYFAIADLFVFHTLFDPFGAVLSEAMAAKVPVVSSIYAAATKDLVLEGVTGYQIDPKEIESSAETILRALDLSSDQKALRVQEAYNLVKKFNMVTAAEEMVSFMKSLEHPEEKSQKVFRFKNP